MLSDFIFLLVAIAETSLCIVRKMTNRSQIFSTVIMLLSDGRGIGRQEGKKCYDTLLLTKVSIEAEL